jgi:hypothetical protein
MKVRRLFLATIFLVLLFGCSTAQPKPAADAEAKAPARESVFKTADEFDADDVAAIHAMRDQWLDAFGAGNPSPIAFMFENDAVFRLPDHLTSNPSDLFSRFTATLTFDENSRFVTDGGDPRRMTKLPWVSYYSNYKLKLTPKAGDEGVETSGQFMTRFHRQPDSSLKVARGPRVGERAPDFTLKAMKSEETIHLASLLGKPTVLIFGSYT